MELPIRARSEGVHAGARSIALALVAVAAAYYLGAKIGLTLALVDGTVTPLWPPTGIAFVALLVVGWRAVPAVALGAFLVNLELSGGAVTSAALIAVGNTLAPVVAVAVVRACGATRLFRLRDAAVFVVAALGSTTISAAVGTGTLFVGGSIDSGALVSTASVWWAGDGAGMLVFGPLGLWLLRGPYLPEGWSTRWVEGAGLMIISTVVCLAVFHSDLRLLYLVFPLIIWGALRFEHVGATSLSVLFAVIAGISAVDGVGPFTGTLAENMVTFHVFVGGVASTGLLFSAAVRERREAAESVSVSERDMEMRVRARTAELEAANERLRGLDEMKDAFMSAVSHELRTPLTVVRGAAETMLRPDVRRDPELVDELIERLASNALRLDRLLSDLLDLDRLRRGVIQPHRKRIQIAEVARSVLATLDLKGHLIDVTSEDVTGRADPAQLERIIENLIANAVKHTPEGTRIWVRARRVQQGVALIVEDDGPGIPAEEAVSIFEPFVQSDVPSYAPGTGVGLSLVARFADLHGGRAWVEEREGGGASFHVYLPDRPPASRAAAS